MDFRFKLFLEGILIGFIAGFVIVFYRLLLEKADLFREIVYTNLKSHSWWFILLWFLILIVTGYLVGYMTKKEPMISGSGIPQVKGQLSSQLTVNWARVIVGKFIGGVLAIGAGLSLGREGPSVQLGAAVGHGIGRSLGRLKIENKYLITSGASAGLAAAFNAPLAGVIFALEEMHKNFSPIVLSSAMAASLTADFVSQRFFGQKPVFNFQALPDLPLNHFLFLIVLGIIIGLFGVLFNYFLVKTLDLYSKWGLSPEFKVIIPITLAGLLGFVLPEVLGGGHHLINKLRAEHLTLTTLSILLIVKFLFTMLSYGSGAPGGIFLPLLVIGALTGNIYGDIINKLLHIDSAYINNFIVLSMAAYFTAIVKAPITGSILITEMTGSFSHLFALATVSMTAYLVTELLHSRPVYEILLERVLKSRGVCELGTDCKKMIIEIPVCLGSELDQKKIRDIKWPKDCLLVGIKRGENEIIPNGNTLIQVGDYLIVLTNEDKEVTAKKVLSLLAGECNI
jgi:H+/Cl- antiporter ClcA